MIGNVEPHMLKRDGRRLTILDCGLGGHSGHFTVTRVTIAGETRWACDACRAAVLDQQSTDSGPVA